MLECCYDFKQFQARDVALKTSTLHFLDSVEVKNKNKGNMKTPTQIIATRMIYTGQFLPGTLLPKKISAKDNSHLDNSQLKNSQLG